MSIIVAACSGRRLIRMIVEHTADTRWICFIDPPRSGSQNMWIDEALLYGAEKCPNRVTVLRFYGWMVPTVSIGRHQLVETAVNEGFCRHKGIPIIRRPTGGRAVFHNHEVTYSVISNDRHCFPLGKLMETYRLIASALRWGLRRLDVAAELVEGKLGRDLRPSSFKNPCFVSASRHELIWRGRKLVGSAQRRLRRSFLQHGSIPLNVDYQEMASVLGLEKEILQRALVSLSEAGGRSVSFQEVCRALRQGFEETFGGTHSPFAS